MVLCVCLNPALQRSLFLEQLRPGHVNRVGELRLSAGGKGVNAARVVQQMGGSAVLMGLFG
ncbi:1-phosphofructokinase, partial [bacterium]|nr:1-phosphofructokinase [bacterium]